MFKNSIFIPSFKNLEKMNIGGPKTFLCLLKDYLNNQNFPFDTENYKYCQSIFFPISYDIKKLIELKKCGFKIIQRLNGIYYPEKHGNLTKNKNLKIKFIYKHLVDHIIFQSEYSQKICKYMFGPPCSQNNQIIFNGTDSKVFYPCNFSDRSNFSFTNKNVNLIITGNFRSMEQLVPLIKAFHIVKNNIRVTLKIIGPISCEIMPEIKKLGLNSNNIFHIPRANKFEIAKNLRESDILLFSHLNSSCPNTIIEAISSGLPIIAFKSGAIPELLNFNTELLVETPEKLIHSANDLNYHLLSEKILFCIKNYKKQKRISIENCKKYSFEKTGDQYIKVFNSTFKSSLKNSEIYFKLKTLSAIKLLKSLLQ
jgi:glycosyltransferase involved in cell wall biosynthesis